MNKNSGEKVTIDDLAVMVAKGFVDTKTEIMGYVDQRISQLEEKTDNRFNDLEAKVDHMDSKLSNQLDYVMLHYTRRTEHEQLSKRVGKLERN